MYENYLARTRTAHSAPVSAVLSALAIALATLGSPPVLAQDFDSASVIRKISERSEKLEITTHTSRILTLDKNIPRVQVNNPELLAVTPLSAKDVQISAKKAGVTQVNLWDEEGNIHTVDVMIYGDARELSNALQTQFPHSSIRVYRYSESLVLTGFVDRPDHIGPMMRLAEDYAPKVINNINVGGVQQILLKVKVMEISRTKLRRMATDFTWLDANGGFFSTGVSRLLVNTTNNAGNGFQTVTDTAGKAAEFGIVGDDGAFFGFIDWLQQNQLAKILSEPNIVAVSGRPAQFIVGGEIPIVVPQSLGTASIEFKPFGTQIDFLPIVLGNGNIRLEVRPRVSEIDDSRSVIIQDFVIPALTVRHVDTAVEMKAGQTFALAGLVQERTETLKRGLPYVSDWPVVGLPFRRMDEEVNEIELLIVVTPEFVDPIDACDFPCGGPGTYTTQPDNCDLYCGGKMEVPNHCNPIRGLEACGQMDCNGCSTCNGGANCNGGSNCNGCNSCQGDAMPVITDGVDMPGGVGYDESDASAAEHSMTSPDEASSPPADLKMPAEQPADQPPQDGGVPADGVRYLPSGPNYGGRYSPPTSNPQSTAPTPYSPPRHPVFMRNASRPNNPQPAAAKPQVRTAENNLIGPVGYDVQ
jgi:pilus assembly protein CpaC